MSLLTSPLTISHYNKSFKSFRDPVSLTIPYLPTGISQELDSSLSNVPKLSSSHEEPSHPLQIYTRQSKPPTHVTLSITLPSINLASVICSDPKSLLIALHKGKWTYVTKHPICYYINFDSLSTSFFCITYQLSSPVTEALSKPKWLKAMELEMTSWHENKTSKLIPSLLGIRHVDNRCVYVSKFNPDGTVDRLKAWLVVDYTWNCDIDYGEAFSPVAKISSIWVSISIAANFG